MLRVPFDQTCRELLDATPNRQSRHSFRSALRHLEKAELLVDVDPAMSAFRALTAEEEAASGLMHCLKERGYNNAGLLKPRDHVQKNAVSPFLSVLGMAVAKTVGTQLQDFKLLIETESAERRLAIALPMFVEGKEVWARPIPPLNFTITSAGKALSYRPEIERLVAISGRADIIEYLRMRANQRNLLLYAGPEGYPEKVQLPDGFHQGTQNRVLALLRAYLLIQPYNERLTFVQDALDAFLNMLGSLKQHDLHEFL